MQKAKAKVAIVDDHVLLRTGLASLIHSLDDFVLLFETSSGKDFMEQMTTTLLLPDIILLNTQLSHMEGYATALWLKQNHPDVKVLALSMNENKEDVVRMLENGARGYIPSTTDGIGFRGALNSMLQPGFYYSGMVTGRVVHAATTWNNTRSKERPMSQLNQRETEFLKLVCTEMTYKEIADKMYVSPRTVDGYRDSLFAKLNAKTRVGLVIYAIRHGIFVI